MNFNCWSRKASNWENRKNKTCLMWLRNTKIVTIFFFIFFFNFQTIWLSLSTGIHSISQYNISTIDGQLIVRNSLANVGSIARDHSTTTVYGRSMGALFSALPNAIQKWPAAVATGRHPLFLYQIDDVWLRLTPNQNAQPNQFSVEITPFNPAKRQTSIVKMHTCVQWAYSTTAPLFRAKLENLPRVFFLESNCQKGFLISN